MKLKSDIQKLQDGGFVPPFVGWQPVTTTPTYPGEPQVASGAGAQQQEELLSKDMIKSLLENGLPNDVNSFIGSIQEMYNDPSYRISGQINPSSIANRYLGIIGKINNIRFSKESYENSIKELTANGGLNDVAITSTGRMLVLNEEGQVEQITPGEFASDYGKYKALTNADLAHMRATNPNLAFNSDVFNVLSTGIGSKKIQEYLNNAIQSLGSTSNRSDGYVSRKDGKILDGIRIIEENPSIQQSLLTDGVYKITSDESSNLEQGQLALNYIYETLPENAKTYLRAKAAINGLDPDTGIQTILTQFITSKGKVSSGTSISYESQLSKDAGLSREAKADATDKVYQSKLFSENVSDDIRTFTLNPGINYQGVTRMLHWNNILNNKDSMPVDPGSVEDLFQVSSLATVGDRNSVYFGKQKLSPTEARQLGVDLSQGVSKITLPSVIDPQSGAIAPDLDALRNIEKAETRISNAPNMPELEKKRIYEEYGIGDYYGIIDNPDLLSQNGLAHNFYVVTGVGSSRKGAVKPKENKYVDPTGEDSSTQLDYIHKLTGDERQNWVDYLENTLNSGLKKGDNKVVVNTGWFNLLGDLYSGNVYIAEARDSLTPLVVSGVLTEPKSGNTLKASLNRGLASKVQLQSNLD